MMIGELLENSFLRLELVMIYGVFRYVPFLSVNISLYIYLTFILLKNIMCPELGEETDLFRKVYCSEKLLNVVACLGDLSTEQLRLGKLV